MGSYSEVGTLAAGVVAGVDLTADTEIAIMTVAMPKGGVIKEISWGWGNVVDAKAATGYMELKSNLKVGPWRWPVGQGAGGAAACQNGKRGKLKVLIPVQKDEIITLYATMTEACVASHANIKWEENESASECTYMDCNTVEDAALTAATLETQGSVTIPAGKGGTIKKIFHAMADVTNAKTAAGYVDIIFGGHGGPHRYVVGGGCGGATDGSPSMQAEEIDDLNIPVDSNEIVTFYTYCTDAKVNLHVGILWVGPLPK